MSDEITYNSVTLDCPAPPELAAFYARLTGGEVAFQVPPYAVLVVPGGAKINFQLSDAAVPAWPGGARPHLEFFVTDLEAAGARAVEAGATLCGYQPNSDHCFVYADPAGHPFCLSLWGDVPPANGE